MIKDPTLISLVMPAFQIFQVWEKIRDFNLGQRCKRVYISQVLSWFQRSFLICMKENKHSGILGMLKQSPINHGAELKILHIESFLCLFFFA